MIFTPLAGAICLWAAASLATPSTDLGSSLTIPTALESATADQTGAPASPRAALPPSLPRLGQAVVHPDQGVSGQFGEWTVTYTAGERAIETGGAIRMQLPDSWHAGPRNSANPLQATHPAADHYVSASASDPSVQLQVEVESQSDQPLVKHPKQSLDGRNERYVFVVRVSVAKGRLDSGARIQVVYGDRSGGSRGYRAAAIASPPEKVLVAVDPLGGGEFELLEELPSLTSVPGEPVELLFHLPSSGVRGEPARAKLAWVDAQNNPVSETGSVTFRVLSGNAELPQSVKLDPARGWAEFMVTPQSEGVLRVRAQANRPGLQAASNPMRVHAAPPDRQLLWGDLHSHTGFSWDGVGAGSFDYARQVSGLDFYAMTDHSMAPSAQGTRGLSERNWNRYLDLADQRNDPPGFITLLAYECSFGAPYGHHNVYFRGRPGALVYPSKSALPELWALLESGQALTIPHHTGKFPSGVDFSIHDPERRRNFEIYSGHGLSEAYQPAHPLAFEHSLFTSDARSLKTPSYAQDAWIRGLRLSTIASSDDHRAQPGQPHFGLAAVYAADRSREGVFQALYDRRTYATTGAKILLNFTIDGAPMGGRVHATKPKASVDAVGTDAIERVELLRWKPESGRGDFEVVAAWTPNALEFQGTHADGSIESRAIYYVRLQQRNLIRGRMVMAWSSPIWVRADP